MHPRVHPERLLQTKSRPEASTEAIALDTPLSILAGGTVAKTAPGVEQGEGKKRMPSYRNPWHPKARIPGACNFRCINCPNGFVSTQSDT
jgi:hypothetical protein